jgi:hypothetical protein
LNPGNVLLDDLNRPLIGDYGVTRDYLRNPAFIAPEMLSGEKCKSKVDVWAFGMLTHLVITSKPHFPPSADVRQDVLAGRLPPLSVDLPHDTALLIGACLSAESTRRPNFDRILHAFLTGGYVLQWVDGVEYEKYRRLVHPMREGESRIFELRDKSAPDCLFELGMCHLRGSGGAIRNVSEAAKYLVMAADQGHVDAQFALGLMYYRQRREEPIMVKYLVSVRSCFDRTCVHPTREFRRSAEVCLLSMSHRRRPPDAS